LHTQRCPFGRHTPLPPSTVVRTVSRETQHILRSGRPRGGGVFEVRIAKYLLQIFRDVRPPVQGPTPPSPSRPRSSTFGWPPPSGQTSLMEMALMRKLLWRRLWMWVKKVCLKISFVVLNISSWFNKEFYDITKSL